MGKFGDRPICDSVAILFSKQGWQCDSHKQFMTRRLSQTGNYRRKLVQTVSKPFAAH